MFHLRLQCPGKIRYDSGVTTACILFLTPWLMYRYYGVNLNNLAECLNLLPAHRDAYSMQVATDLINFCRQMGEHLPQINNMVISLKS